ncbi:MAG: MFS transporter [Candidatus Dormibacteraeota bacterium]|nr:MFS transporter [Candidatus Dormibacteraeota bacterium]
MNSQRRQRLIPLAFITYTFAYLDRSNYSIGAAGGLVKSLHITPGTAGLLGALFFLGYFFFQIPAAHYAETGSVKRLIFWSLIGWGIFAAAQGVIPSVPLLMVDRFLLGVVEAVVLPCMLIFLAHWFTSPERGRANTFLILGNPVTVLWLSAVSGYLIQATSWQWMFIVEGLPAVVWAFVFRWLADDRPSDAAWLDPAEKRAIETQLAAEQRTLPAVSGYWEAFRRPTVIILSAQYLLWSVGVYGLVFWLPTIIKAGSHQGIGNTGALSAVPYLLAVILMLVVSYFSDRSGRRVPYVWPFLFLGGIAFYASYLVGTSSFLVSFVLLIIVGGAIYSPYGPFFALISELLPQNVSGAAMALINSFGALGGFVGTYAVGLLIGSTHGQGGAFVFLAACLIAAGLLMLPVRSHAAAKKAQLQPGSTHA